MAKLQLDIGEHYHTRLLDG